uniref:Tubulin--tyrosine ligase-like protein 9 n=1 Tax=Macrostomum lignano TaxID=282301 RepID=A0A1I8HYV3_9PLAT
MPGRNQQSLDPADLLDPYDDSDEASLQSFSASEDNEDDVENYEEGGEPDEPLTLEDDPKQSLLQPDSYSENFDEEDEGEGEEDEAAMRNCAKKLGLREADENDDWNVFWTDTAKINHFPGMSEICRKDCLARNLSRMRRLFPKEFNIAPRTWVLPADYADLQAYARSRKHRTYILKPDAGCQGRGIWFTRCVKDIKPTDNLVCQLYVSRPFLIDDYKFDLRVYVLVAGCDPFRIFVFKDGLARFTTVKYRDPSAVNLDNVYMHLTNYAVQKNCQQYVRNDEEDGTKRRISTINRWLAKNGHDVAKLWSDIDDVIIKTILSAHGVLRHNYRSCFPDTGPSSACFEILGFDIILDRSLRPLVLEVNHSPSFSTDSQLDLDIKSALILDTLRLVNIGAVDKRKAMEEERRKARDRLFQRGSRREGREDTERDLAQSAESLRRYEDAHLGNYRRIYPPQAGQADRYERFMTQAGSIYHETAAARARADCARQLRRDLERKWAEEREFANRQQQQQGTARQRQTQQQQQQQQKQKQARPESPTDSQASDRVKTKRESAVTPSMQQTPTQPLPPRSLRMTKRTPTSYSLASREAVRERAESQQQLREAADTSRAQPIVDEEEIERLSGLLQRDNLLRSMGITELVYRMLHCTPGTVPMAALPGNQQLPAIAFKNGSSGGKSIISSTKKADGGHRSARLQQQQMLMLMQLQRQTTAPEMPMGRTGSSGRGAATLVYQRQPHLQSAAAAAAAAPATASRLLPDLTPPMQPLGQPQLQQQQQLGSSMTTAPTQLSVVSASAPVAARAASADPQQQMLSSSNRAGRSQRLRQSAAGETFERQSTVLTMR